MTSGKTKHGFALKAFLSGAKQHLEVEEDVYRLAVPLYSDAHPGCAECHNLSPSDHILLGSLNVYVPLSNAKKEVWSILLQNLAVVSLIGLILTLSVLFLLRRFVLLPIDTLNSTAKELASGDGDLTKRLPVKGDDEIGRASGEVNRFIEKVQHTIHDVVSSSHQNNEAASRLVSSANTIGKGIEKSASIIDTVTHDAQSMKTQIESSLVVAQETRDDINKAAENLEEARRKVESLAEHVEASASIESELSEKLNKSSPLLVKSQTKPTS